MEAVTQFSMFVGALDLFTWAIYIAAYVFQGLGLYTIAKRRGIQNAWLAWVPLGNVWLLGKIADHYCQVSRGEKKNRRTALLVLSVLGLVIAVAWMVSVVVFAVNNTVYMTDYYYGPSYSLSQPMTVGLNDNAVEILMNFALLNIIFILVLLGIGIAATILQLVCLHDVYESCDPGNKTLYLLLSIFLGLAPVFLFVCRNKDQGMFRRPPAAPVGYAPNPYQQYPYQPPRYPGPEYSYQQLPQYQPPQYGYQPPQYQPPQYQPPQYQPPQYQPPQYQASVAELPNVQSGAPTEE